MGSDGAKNSSQSGNALGDIRWGTDVHVLVEKGGALVRWTSLYGRGYFLLA